MRIAIVLALLAITTPAQAQARRFPGGWAMHERIAPPGVVGLGCGRAVAYVRNGSGDVSRWDGRGWSELPRQPGSRYGRTLGVTPEGALFLESNGGVAQWTGSGWVDHALERWEGDLDSGFAAISPTEVYYVGRGRIARFDGAAFTTYGASTWRRLTSIAVAGDDLLIGGQGGTFLRFHGGAFTREEAGIDTTILQVVALAPDDVWALADGATWNDSVIVHWDGQAWSRRDPPGRVTAIGGARDAVYAVSARGLERWSGTSWTTEIARAELGAGHHALADVCATDLHVIVADAGGHALVRPR